MATDLNDYYVITSRRGEQPECWSWEIFRKSKPLGIKMADDGYQSDQAAQFAGKRVLTNFFVRFSTRGKTEVGCLSLRPAAYFDFRGGPFGADRDAQFWNYPLQGLLVHEDGITS